jgi:hypothetical protein
MEENTPQKNSTVFVLKQKSRGSSQFLTTLNKNGVAERKNRTIIEATKAMIHDQSLHIWVEACITTICVQNRSPHQILKNITPEEPFIGVKPKIGHFRIFGCPVYLHIPKEKRSKLEHSGRKGTFVG